MTSCTRKPNRTTYPQQGKLLGWIFWALFSAVGLNSCTRSAQASVSAPAQTTFAALAVGQTSAPVTITLTAQASGTASAPTVLTEGTANAGLAEFTLIDAGTCSANPNLSPGQSCTVSVAFAPRFPGFRHGAVVLKTAGGEPIAAMLISGIGQGGLPVLTPGQIGTVAGDGQWFYQGDNVPATQAPIYLPSGLAVDGAGNLFVADTINNRVRRVDAVTQMITTVAGNGTAGFAGDGSAATTAELAGPMGLALDGAGNLFIADTGNNAIRRVDAVSGIISTIAGTPGHAGFSGDDGSATAAKLNAPQGLTLTPAGDLLIADTNNAAVRAVTFSDGTITTLAGTGVAGFNGDNILATSAQLNDPVSVAIRADGAIAVADLTNNRVRLFTVGGNITTLAGNGSGGYTGDGGTASAAELQGPAAVAFDPAGDLFIADSVNNCIRLVVGAGNIITTLAGTPTDDRYAGDGGPDNAARMHGPDGLVFDAAGNLWISDRFNNRVRQVSGSLLTIGPYPTMKVGKTSQPVVEQMLNGGNEPLNLSAPVLQQAALDSTTTTCGQSSLAPSTYCQMGVEFKPQNVGPNITGSLTWNSDAPNVTPVDQLYGQVLSVEPTSVVLSSSTNPGLIGQPLVLTATVSSDDTSRTGTVDFIEGGTTWCSAVGLAADGTATCQIPSLSLGTHSFTANYSGDNNNAASQSPVYQEIVKQQAALALAVSSSPSTVTSTVTLTLSASDAAGTPTGSAVFYDGATPLATVTLDGNGNASWSSSTFAVGTHVITAQYAGDSANVAGSTSPRTLVIAQAVTVTVLGSSNGDAPVGAPVTLNATVVSNNGPAPTGAVQFLDGSVVLGASGLVNGTATLSVNNLTPGPHSLSAVYSGDADDATSTSAPLTETVEQIGTVTTLGADVDPANAGATVTFTALTVITPGASADGALTGVVTFRDGSTILGSSPVNSTGQAILPVKALAVGSHAVVAVFSGNINYAGSNSNTVNEVVQQTPVTVALSAATATALMGKPVAFSVTVASQTGVPTGNIAVRDGNALLGTAVLDAHGAANFSTSSLSAGVHSITAVYEGDANYLAATSIAVQQTVNLAPTTVLLSGPPAAVDAGTVAHFTASLASPGVTPTGSLVLVEGATVLGTEPVSGDGSFTFTTATLTVGAHSIMAKYSGDLNNSSAASSSVTVLISQAPTVTSLAVSANPLTQGGVLKLSASLSTDGPNPTGNITFFDGATSIGTAALDSNGAATWQASNLTLGSHSLSAVYSGDTNHAGSTSVAVPELVVQSSSSTLSASVNPAISGQNITFTGQITGYPTPTGTAVFRDNGTALATVQVNSAGIATFQTSTLNVGTHDITFSYAGDDKLSASTASLSETILNASTQTTLTASANPAAYGQPLKLSATVSSNGGTATGTVVFSDAGTTLGSASLDGAGITDLTLSNLSPGVHTIAAVYLGDGKATTSTSKPLSVAIKQTTTLVITSNPNPAQTLTSVDLSATLTNAGAATANGVVTFYDGNVALGSAPLDGSGHATLTLPQFGAGTHAITATYGGDDADFASQAPAFNLAVSLRPTTTTVTGTASDPANPQQMTLIAVIKGGGAVAPIGTVNFVAGNVTLGVAAVDPTGVASITVIFNAPTQQVVASYGGDISYAASQSASTPITAGQPAQFTVAVDTQTVSVASHQHASLTVTVASVKGFTDNIALGCLGLPYAATCTFDSSQLKLAANGSVKATLVIDTGDPLGAGSNVNASVHSRSTVVFACLLPGALLLAGSFRKRRGKVATLLFVCLLAIGLGVGATGCSGLQMSGTPPGTYTVRIVGTGQGSNTTQAQTVTLVVTQ